VNSNLLSLFTTSVGSAVAQAVSGRLPTAAARVRPGSGHVGFVVEKNGTEAFFSPRTLVSPVNSHLTNCSTFTNMFSILIESLITNLKENMSTVSFFFS
jgi:hypothetical protein